MMGASTVHSGPLMSVSDTRGLNRCALVRERRLFGYRPPGGDRWGPSTSSAMRSVTIPEVAPFFCTA
jgi:hypothetical protein